MPFLFSEQAGGILQLSLADGGSVQASPAPGGSALGGVLYLPTGAALTAVNVSGMPSGQLAVVQTFGAVWTLEASLLPVDGATVLASSGATRRWIRGPTLVSGPAQAQATWIIDPIAGSDEGAGPTLATAVKTYGEIARRWGTQSPSLKSPVTLQWASSGPASDPVVVTPIITGAGQLTLTNNGLVATQTTTISVFTPKNRNAGTLNTITAVGVASWAALVGALVHDTTAGATFFIDRDAGGGVAEITEPFQLAGVTGFFSPPTQLIANGDTVQLFAPAAIPSIYIPASGGQDLSSSFAGFVIQALTLNADILPILTSVTLAECSVAGSLQLIGQLFLSPAIVSCRLQLILGTGSFFGGSIQGAGSQVAGLLTYFDGDVIVRQRIHPSAESEIVIGCAYFGQAHEYEDGPVSWIIQTSAYGPGGTQPVVWGPGPTNVAMGAQMHLVGYTAVNTFRSTGGLQIDGAATGFTFNLGTGTFSAGAIALTPASLDANVSFQNPRTGSRMVVGA